MIDRIVLLAGGLKASPFVRACGTSVLNLPLGVAGSVLDLWRTRFAAISGLLAPSAHIDIAVGEEQSAELRHAERDGIPTRIVRDASEYRGPAGTLRDATSDLLEEDAVLVAEGSRVVAADLTAFVKTHLARACDASVAVNPDGSPAGVYCFTAKALRQIPTVGFMDLKEQFLSRLVDTGHSVRVFRLDAPGVLQCRTRTDFLAAAMAVVANAASNEDSASVNPGPAILSRSAVVDPTAFVAHAVIGPNSRVEAGAVLVRSLVTGSAVVPAGASLCDAVVSARGIHANIE